MIKYELLNIKYGILNIIDKIMMLINIVVAGRAGRDGRAGGRDGEPSKKNDSFSKNRICMSNLLNLASSSRAYDHQREISVLEQVSKLNNS